MTPVERCQRCQRPASHAVALDAATLVLCRHHAEQLADAVAGDPVVTIGRRRVRVEAPMLTAGVRR